MVCILTLNLPTIAFGCFETGSHLVQAESHTTELKLTLNS